MSLIHQGNNTLIIHTQNSLQATNKIPEMGYHHPGHARSGLPKPVNLICILMHASKGNIPITCMPCYCRERCLFCKGALGTPKINGVWVQLQLLKPLFAAPRSDVLIHEIPLVYEAECNVIVQLFVTFLCGC